MGEEYEGLILDANAVNYWLKGKRPDAQIVQAFLSRAQAVYIPFSVLAEIRMGEILFKKGLAKSQVPFDEALLRNFYALIDGGRITVLNTNRGVIDAAAELAAALKETYSRTEDELFKFRKRWPDVWVVAFAKYYNWPVLTFDKGMRKAFSKIAPGVLFLPEEGG